jgi:glycerol-3-phosphate dehydrogenase
LPLLGADGYESLWRQRSDLARRHGVALGVVEHLLERFGSLSLDVLRLTDDDPTLRHPIEGAPEYIAAEAVYAASAEGVRHIDDVLSRRTRISFETAHRGAESARHVAELMAGVLGWSATRVEEEVAGYLAKVASEREAQLMPDDLAADSVLLK